MATIGVVIPTLGRESLRRALLSVARQALLPDEVVVVNNGPDHLGSARTEELTGTCAPVPLRLLSLPPFSGPAIARNVGAWHMSADFVAFLDDDDEFSDEYLSTIMAAMLSGNGHLFYPTKVWPSSSGGVLKEKRLRDLDRNKWFERLYRHENHGFGGNLVIERNTFFELGGFRTDLPSGEDRALAMAALKSGVDICYVEEAVVRCYKPVGIRAKQREDKWISNLKIMYMYRHDVTRRTRAISWYRWCRMAVAALWRGRSL